MSPQETAQVVLTPTRGTIKVSDLRALAQAYLEMQAVAQAYADTGRSSVAWLREPQALVTPPSEQWGWRTTERGVIRASETDARLYADRYGAIVVRRFEYVTEWEEVP